MANWGLISSATANAPRDVLARMLAEQRAAEEQEFTRGMERARQELDARRVAVSESDLAMRQRDAQAKADAKTQAEAEFESVLAATPDWAKPAIRLRKVLGMSIDPDALAMSPQERIAAESKKKADDEAAEEARKARELSLQHGYRMQEIAATPRNEPIVLVEGKNGPEYVRQRDAVGQAPGDKGGSSVSAAVKNELADMDTLVSQLDDIVSQGDAVQWRGVGGFGKGSISQFFKKNFDYGSQESEGLRNLIGNVKGQIAKLRGGTSFTDNEQKLLESYVPTIDDSPGMIKSKIEALKSAIERKQENLFHQYSGSGAVGRSGFTLVTNPDGTISVARPGGGG